MSVPTFMGVDLSSREDVTRVIFMQGKKIVDRETVAHCAVCGNAKCDHSDLAYAGIVPPPVLLS